MASLTPAPFPDRDGIRRIGAASRAALAANGGSVSVRGYSRMRNGKREMVRAHERSDPPGGQAPADHRRQWAASTLEEVEVWLLAAKRPEGGGVLGGREAPLGPPIGGGGVRPGAPSRPAPQPPMPPAEAARLRQELRDIVAPNGQPIGQPRRGSAENIRGLPGGDAAAREFFNRLTSGRGGVDVPKPGFDGRIIRLPDGTHITYRPGSSSGTPAIDISSPGWTSVRRIHFND